MLSLPGRGLNFLGIESHVFLPMMTAFVLPSLPLATALVTLEKWAISDFSLQGRPFSLGQVDIRMQEGQDERVED